METNKQVYSLKNVEILKKKFDEFLEALPKKTYTYPEITTAFISALFEKAYWAVKEKEGVL